MAAQQPSSIEDQAQEKTPSPSASITTSSSPRAFDEKRREPETSLSDPAAAEKNLPSSSPPSSAPNAVPPPPDGGYHAWAQVVAGHLVVALTWGYASSFGVFQTYYVSTLPQTSSDISWIGGFQVWCLLVISPFAGRATDAGLSRWVIGAGAILLTLGTFMTSLATTYWQIFLAQGLCVGIGQGLMWLPTVTLISTYFAKMRILAVTAAATGTSTGGMIFPAVVQYAMPKVGYPWAVRIMGFITLFMCLVVMALVRPRLPPRKSGPLIDFAAFKEPQYVLFTFGIFCLYWSLYFAFFYIQVFATDVLHISQQSSVNLIIVTNALGIPIRAPCGYLADRYLGPLNLIIPFVALCGILMFCWIAVSSIGGLYAFACFYGLASAAAMALFAGSIPSLTSDLSKVGTRVGMALFIVSLGPLTGPSVAGAIISDEGGGYVGAQVWAGATLLVGAAALGAARVMISGPVLMKKL